MDRTRLMENWLAQCLPGQRVALAPASPDASFRRYFRATLADGSTRIVMDAPPSHEDCSPYLHVARLFHDACAHVPEIHAENLVEGFLLLSYLCTNVIGKAFDEGWGAVVCKTVSLDATKVVNVQPRYGRLRAAGSQEIIGWENIELISDRGFDVWIDEFKQLQDKYPERVLIASIMEELRTDAWVEIVERCQAAGVDAFECNFSCPHGLPERRMGSAMGEKPEILE